MNKIQKYTVTIALLALVFFLILSVVTSNWKFFLWSTVPIALSLMTTFLAKGKPMD